MDCSRNYIDQEVFVSLVIEDVYRPTEGFYVTSNVRKN